MAESSFENSYQQQALNSATGMDLVLALYDGAIRFLYRAIQAVEEDDMHGRRMAIKRVVDILMYLQARLRPDMGGHTAAALSEFYAAMFTMTLEASHLNSKEQLEEVVACMRNVREAWQVAARDPDAGSMLPRELRTREERRVATVPSTFQLSDGEMIQRWTA
jgi:flagellar protein FliS